MNIIQSAELFTAISLGIVGLSHLVQPKIWVDFFVFLHARKHVGNIFNALISLGTGSLILSFHFIWYWPQVLVTIYGAMQVIKGFIYLLIPSIGLSSIGKVTMEKANRFRWAGLIMFMLSLVIMYGLVNGGAFR